MRQALHALQAVAIALAGGTVVFAGISDVITHDIAGMATLVGIAITAYLGGTTTGSAK